jgi:hypothetical protein
MGQQSTSRETNSSGQWLMGANIPGKTREPLIYIGGVPAYHRILEEVAEEGFEGFDVA